MTEREAAHLIASKGEESVYVKELRGELPNHHEVILLSYQSYSLFLLLSFCYSFYSKL